MSKYFKIIIILLIVCLVFNNKNHAQVSDAKTSKGTVEGKVKDSSLNYFLQTATVSVYDSMDKLVCYTLTNHLGEFKLTSIPLNHLLQLRISFVGYKTFLKYFRINFDEAKLNLGVLVVEKNYQMLGDIIIAPPPVRLNKDTLEFFSDAFELDKNATTEDLLKKLPGIVVWGDGLITVNGREITKLLVNGKPFLGGEARIATQNLPKSVIEKVQVYQENINPDNPYDSITAINLRLKKNAENGLFGIVAAGAGINQTYESVLGMNMYNEKNQLGLISQSNNVNKMSSDLNSLLENSTFKSGGVELNNQTDFEIIGANKQYAGGVVYTHDFIPVFSYEQQNRLATDVFHKKNQNNTNKESNVFSFLEGERMIKRHVRDHSQSDISDLIFSGSYYKRKNYQFHFIEVNFKKNINNFQNEVNTTSELEGMGNISFAEQYDSLHIKENFFSLKAGIDHNGSLKASNAQLNTWKINYSANVHQSNKNQRAISSLQNAASTEQLNLDRNYWNTLDDMIHTVSFTLGDFGKLLFRNYYKSPRLVIQFENSISWQIEQIVNRIKDKDFVTFDYYQNSFLSTIGNYKEWREIPGVKISRSYLNILANRYQKDWQFEFFPKIIFAGQKYQSTSHSNQNLNKIHNKFLPNAAISYTNYQLGDYIDRYSLRLNSLLNLPGTDRLFLLPDSADIYFIRTGNVKLTPSSDYNISFRFSHHTVQRKNNFSYGVSFSTGITKNYFADSISLDQRGRSIYYNINLNGYRYLNLNLFYNKSFLFSENQLQLKVNSASSLVRNPGYFGHDQANSGKPGISNLLMQNDSLSVFYLFKSSLVLSYTQSLTIFKNRLQKASDASFYNLIHSSQFGIGFNPVKKFKFNSSISYRRNISSNVSDLNSTIINASLSYRFLASDNLELKLSGWDLLNQNKGIVNYGNLYSYTNGTTNLLHRYFMVTLSLYPRKFGKKK